MKRDTVWAVLPVAGRSRRMHDFKPLLELGEGTILEQTISRFHEAGIYKIAAVTGHRREEIAPVLKKMHVLEVYNPEYAVKDMLYSVQAGVRAVMKKETVSGIFISPGDSPLIHPFTIMQLMEECGLSDMQAVVPSFRGRNGHPPLLLEEALAPLLAYDGEGGLRGYMDSLVRVCRREIPDSSMLLDADTPEDYVRLLRAYRYWEIPDEETCLAVWDYAGTPAQVRNHCRRVAKISQTAGQRALGKVPKEERERFQMLIRAGALLHDVMRTAPAHEAEGGRLLRRLGYGETAGVVEAHRVLRAGETQCDTLEKGGWHTAAKWIVYCADRLTDHDLPCEYDERYDRKRRAFEGNPEALLTLERDKERFWQCRLLLKEWSGYDLFE